MIDPAPPATPEDLDRHSETIEAWLRQQLEENPTVAAVDRDDSGGERRWIARLTGEEKATFSVWFTLRQRMLHVESYMMPAPEEQLAETYAHLLRRNLRLSGLRFAIGAEDAVFVMGELPVARIAESELDRLLGSVYATVEQCFRPAMRLGYASRFTG